MGILLTLLFGRGLPLAPFPSNLLGIVSAPGLLLFSGISLFGTGKLSLVTLLSSGWLPLKTNVILKDLL